MKVLTRDELVALLRERGLRVTAQRLGIHDALVTLGRHATPDEVVQRVRQHYPAVSANTVYETLETLERAGAIRRGDVAAGPLRYDPNIEPHDHLVCRSCGTQRDVVSNAKVPPAPADPQGFAVESALVTFFGLCPACQATA